MSLFYAEGNDESSIDLFRKRIVYKGKMVRESLKYKNIVDFNFGEKFFYGRTSRTFMPIKYSAAAGLKDFKNSAGGAVPNKAASFVVDAFEDLVIQFQKCALTGKISKSDPFLSNLKVYKSYRSSAELYDAHIDTYFNSISSEFLRSDIRVKNFDEFIKEFMLLMRKSAKKFPFTQTAFVKSKYCPLMSSGLALEIADIDVFNDDKKIAQFVNSKNWGFYVNACNSYGFMVDRNIPWRLVADIASSAMLGYSAAYGLDTTDKVLLRGYSYVHGGYYRKFKYFLLKLYNKVRLKNFLTTEDCGGKSISKVVIPKKYTKDQFDAQYSSEEYFMKLYFQIRFIEDESPFEEYEKNILIDDTIELYQARNLTQALNKFERILNKPFDYRGSLSYISIQQNARRNAEEL